MEIEPTPNSLISRTQVRKVVYDFLGNPKSNLAEALIDAQKKIVIL